MKEFYLFDGCDFVDCSDALLSSLLKLCEDNDTMRESINNYFEVEK